MIGQQASSSMLNSQYILNHNIRGPHGFPGGPQQVMPPQNWIQQPKFPPNNFPPPFRGNNHGTNNYLGNRKVNRWNQPPMNHQNRHQHHQGNINRQQQTYNRGYLSPNVFRWRQPMPGNMHTGPPDWRNNYGRRRVGQGKATVLKDSSNSNSQASGGSQNSRGPITTLHGSVRLRSDRSEEDQSNYLTDDGSDHKRRKRSVIVPHSKTPN